jgi:hypothetical protein
MSVIPPGGRVLGSPQFVPPKKQRILAPSTIEAVSGGMGHDKCPCALRITDIVNLTVYFVPMTGEMVTALREALEPYDPQTMGTLDERSLLQ